MADELLFISNSPLEIVSEQEEEILISSSTVATVIVSQESITEIEFVVDSSVVLNPTIESTISSNIQGENISIVDPGLPGFQDTTSGAIFASDVTSATGIVGSKVWEQNTVPVDASIISAVTDTDLVSVHVLVEGGKSLYTPAVTIDGILVNNFTQPSTLVRTYEGSADVLVPTSRTIGILSSSGVSDSVYIERAGPGPVIDSVVFGPYPGTQTELKAGDNILVTVTSASAVSYTIVVGGANASQQTVPIGTSALINISSLSGNQPITVYASNSLGSGGPNFTSTDLILNQTYPSIANITVVYPIEALKNSEIANATASISNFDTVVYSTAPELSVDQGYLVTKDITRIGGSYLTADYIITANRAANDATSVKSTGIRIANLPPTAAIGGLPSSLFSPGTYNISINADQDLLSPGTVEADLGVLTGTSLRIEDSTVKGTGSFFNLNIVGLSGLTGTVISSGATYKVAGFARRTLTVPAYSQTVDIGTYVFDISKTRFRYAGTLEWLTLRNNTSNFVKGYTITDSAGNYVANGNYAFITDLAFAQSNSSGTLKVEIEENG